MILVINNLTGSTRTYLSGAISVPGNSSVTVSNTVQMLTLSTEGDLRSDIFANNASLGDGTNTFGAQDAINYLYEIPPTLGPISDSTGSAITLGQKIMVSSIPVTIASDQSGLPITGTVTANAGTGNFNVVGTGAAGTPAGGVLSVQGVASGTALPVSQNTSPWVVNGSVASGGTNAGLPLKTGGAFNTTQPTVTNGQIVDAQYTARGAAIVATGVDNFNVNNITGTVSLPTGAATSANQATEITSLQLIDNPVGPVTPGAVGTNSFLIGGQFNTALPTVSNTQQVALQVDSSARLIVSPLTTASVVKSDTQDGSGNSITSTAINSKQRLDVNLSAEGVDNTAVPFGTLLVGGVDSTGKLQSFEVLPSGELFTRDVINVSSQYRAQSVTTTAAQALGGATILANRKVITITPTNGTIYWGTNSSVTTTTGTPLFAFQTLTLSFTDNVQVWVIAAATTDVRIMEGS